MQFQKVKLLQEKSVEYNSRMVKSTPDVVKFINEIDHINQLTEETMYVIALDMKNHIIAYNEVAKGAINECYIDIKSIFKPLLLCNASKFILTHNHPSGDPTPSKSDYAITERITEASKLLDFEFIDHIVISGNQFYSIIYNKEVK